jgi:hypothetical protein
MERTLHQRWQREFGDAEDVLMGDIDESEEGGGKYHPFESELDWRIACWAVQEGIGHGSFDRLMGIPGVGVVLIFSLQRELMYEA